MTFEPPAVPPSYTPPQSPVPPPPAYQQPQQPAYPQQQQPNYAQPQPPSYAQQQQPQPQPGYGQQSAQNGRPPRAKNTLGLVSAILGAAAFVLGFIFTFIQLGIYATGSMDSYGILSGVRTVSDALLGLGAIALGVVGYLRGGPSKLLAIVGTTLGVALLLGVLNGLIFTVALPLIY